tara:strand:+ start:206 stop:1171 length:966 start_codon:yes stop_codon:yes gene_type:complete
MPKIIKPANGSFTTADITVDSSGRIIAASTGSAGGTFISATGGDTVTEEGNYKVHRFDSDANFVVSSVGSGDPESAVVDYVVVAGGGAGGGGGGGRGGGGGGGGYRSSGVSFADNKGSGTQLPVSAQTYPIVVGSAGSSPGGGGASGGDGGDSSFSTISANGGGGGGGNQNGRNGGSGGGAGRLANTAGTGNQGSFTPPEGFNAGTNGGGGASSSTSSLLTGVPSPSSGMGAITFVTNNLKYQDGTPTGGENMGSFYSGGGSSSPGHAPGSPTFQAGVRGATFMGRSPGQGANTGEGGNGVPTSNAPNGGSGVVYIRYRYK